MGQGACAPPHPESAAPLSKIAKEMARRPGAGGPLRPDRVADDRAWGRFDAAKPGPAALNPPASGLPVKDGLE